jgi:cysteine synthase
MVVTKVRFKNRSNIPKHMVGNERFAKLVDIIERNHYKFPLEVKNPKGVRGVADLRKRILEERAKGSTETIDFFERCFLDPEIQELMNIGRPQITDYSPLLGLERGKVYGLELRLMGPAGSHKDLMVASLLVMRLMDKGLPREEMDTIADAGFFNSAWATKYYADLFGLRGAYFIQDTTPEHLLNKLENNNFEVMRVPMPDESTGVDKKNATYRALLKRFMTDADFRTRTYHLGHAELGFFSTIPYGRMFTKLLKERNIQPDTFMTPVGAGTTLIGTGEPLQHTYGTELIIGEYEEHGPVKAKIPNKFSGVVSPIIQTIPKSILNKSESVDEALLEYARNEGYDIGITSAGVMATASHLAESEKKAVVVPIFEKYRDYSEEARHVISREIQLNPFIPEDHWGRVGRVYHLERKNNIIDVL